MSSPQEAAGLAVSPAAAVTGALVLLGGLALLPLARAALRALVPAAPAIPARWRGLHLLAVLGLAFVGATVLGIALTEARPGLHELLLGQIATAFGLGAAVAAALWVARTVQPEGLASLGLRSGSNLRSAAAGLACYVLCAPTLVGAMLAWPWLFERLGGTWTQQPIVTQIGELGPTGLVVLVLLAVVLQPLMEELLFRSFVQPFLIRSFGVRGGIVLTSVLFASLHGGSAFLPVFALSLLLGAVMLRTQRLAAVGAVHALHNGLMLLLVFVAPETGGSPAEPSAPGLVLLSSALP